MSSYITKKTPGNTKWFVHDRFGMFIHFGLYAMPARHEWVRNRECITNEDYEKYFERFDPDLFDAGEWARSAKQAGMKYVVLTSKHHEGFCLWDSKYTDYKITKTPFGRDLIKEFVEAFRQEGLKVGFYYSLIDWHHPDFTIDVLHPLRYSPDAARLNEERDMKRYAQYMRDQVTELLTNYGKIDILWFDYSYSDANNANYPALRGKGKEDWESEKLIALARSINPDIIIDNRAEVEQDISTPEQYQMEQWPKDPVTGEYLVWEACQTFSGSWGYYRDELTWKSHQMLIEMLIKTVSLGGNLLMNVGPCARGYFDSRAVSALEAFGKWMKYNSRSIYGCTMAEPELEAPRGTLITQSEDSKRLYVHLLSYPFNILPMKNMADKIAYAQFLHDASEIKYKVGKPNSMLGFVNVEFDEKTVYFNLPVVKPDQAVPVIEIFLK